jgi:hypothetical protein
VQDRIFANNFAPVTPHPFERTAQLQRKSLGLRWIEAPSERIDHSRILLCD